MRNKHVGTSIVTEATATTEAVAQGLGQVQRQLRQEAPQANSKGTLRRWRGSSRFGFLCFHKAKESLLRLEGILTL